MNKNFKTSERKRAYAREYSKQARESNKDNFEFIEYHRIKSKEWYEKNKEKQRENLKKDYQRNKIYWLSRGKTRLVFKELNIIKKCENGCLSEDLQIHHEIYPTKKEEIIEAIKNRKIYYLCKKCHNKIPKKEYVK